MSQATPTTVGLLGMLAVHSWTGYELTGQLRRSLRFVWPISEGHLYREQKRLVELGWARVEREVHNGRNRNRYVITEAGEQALDGWFKSETREPRFEIEGMLRLFHGSFTGAAELQATMVETAVSARVMMAELVGYAEEYLAEGGPLWMLERGVGGPGERLEWLGREVYPERLHVIALVIDGTTRLLETLADFADQTAAEAGDWESPASAELTGATRARLQAVVQRSRDHVAEAPAKTARA